MQNNNAAHYLSAHHHGALASRVVADMMQAPVIANLFGTEVVIPGLGTLFGSIPRQGSHPEYTRMKAEVKAAILTYMLNRFSQIEQ